MCRHRQPAEPSTTEAQRLQGPRTRDGPKTEKNKTESLKETEHVKISSRVIRQVSLGDPTPNSQKHVDIL